MSHCILDPDDVPADDGNECFKGHEVAAVGPSDSSDSGSDLMGLGWNNDNSDRQGTGEGMTVDQDPDLRSDADIDFDRIVGSEEAGLGGGFDQAEEALFDTVEEIEEHFRRQRE